MEFTKVAEKRSLSLGKGLLVLGAFLCRVLCVALLPTEEPYSFDVVIKHWGVPSAISFAVPFVVPFV